MLNSGGQVQGPRFKRGDATRAEARRHDQRESSRASWEETIKQLNVSRLSLPGCSMYCSNRLRHIYLSSQHTLEQQCQDIRGMMEARIEPT